MLQGKQFTILGIETLFYYEMKAWGLYMTVLELERAVASDRDKACGTLMLNHCQGDASELTSEAIGSIILLRNRCGVNP